MNTSTAAIQAGVTTDTIRTWCRIGAVAATKTAGRWIIDTASLARRIAIGAMRARKVVIVTEPTRLTRDERTARAAEIRTRVRAALPLPALTGTTKQISWAEDIRTERIDAALSYINVMRDGSIVYALEGGGRDPLLAFDVKGLIQGDGAFATEQGLIDAVHTCLSTTDYFGGERTRADWWIDKRNRTA